MGVNQIKTPKEMEMPFAVDILESNLAPSLLEILLTDRTSGKNIFWGTNDYANLGAGYQYQDPITIDKITGANEHTIMPRILKTKWKQKERCQAMAEVFTPSWICNKQNNLIDEAWFGQKNVFNTELYRKDTEPTWVATPETINFPKKGKTWKKYIQLPRLEITCGEAPYIVSRYDSTTGEAIPLKKRIGILDRKLRIISENCHTSRTWLRAASLAYKSTYAYEWQGDNLLLAREAMLISFREYYEEKFKYSPKHRSVKAIAEIISWNVWQMDGLKGTIPNTCHSNKDLFGNLSSCPGCKKGDINAHNGTYCIIRDWKKKAPSNRIRFIDLLTQ